MKFLYDHYSFRSNPLFEGKTLLESNLFKEHVQRKIVPADTIIYRRGSYSRGVIIIKRGKVKITQRSGSDQEQILYIFGRGELLGYRSLISNEPHPVTATSLEECVFFIIPQRVFMNAISSVPQFTMFLLAHLSHEGTVWMNLINMQGNRSVKKRVILTLLILNEKYKKAGKSHLPSTINLSRENMAAFAGTTVETFVRMLRTFKDDGILTAQGRRIIIHKPEILQSQL